MITKVCIRKIAYRKLFSVITTIHLWRGPSVLLAPGTVSASRGLSKSGMKAKPPRKNVQLELLDSEFSITSQVDAKVHIVSIDR